MLTLHCCIWLNPQVTSYPLALAAAFLPPAPPSLGRRRPCAFPSPLLPHAGACAHPGDPADLLAAVYLAARPRCRQSTGPSRPLEPPCWVAWCWSARPSLAITSAVPPHAPTVGWSAASCAEPTLSSRCPRLTAAALAGDPPICPPPAACSACCPRRCRRGRRRLPRRRSSSPRRRRHLPRSSSGAGSTSPRLPVAPPKLTLHSSPPPASSPLWPCPAARLGLQPCRPCSTLRPSAAARRRRPQPAARRSRGLAATRAAAS